MPSVLKMIGVALAVGVIAGGALVASVPSTADAATSSRSATIRYVVDGDTVRLLDGRYVRLIGYDTPERGHRYFAAATRLVERIVNRTSGRVRLVNPSSTDDRDHYGRLLRYVRVGRTDVGRRLVASGYGHARYDSHDGYDWHPLEALYHRIDATTRNLWRLP